MKNLFTVLALLASATGMAQNAPVESRPEAAAEAANKFEGLMPPIEGITSKIGAGFWEANWPWLAAALAVAALILFFVFRPRKKRAPSPYEIAAARLNNAADVFEKNGEKAYAEEVGNAVRDYIEAVYKIPAPERTTEEFLEIVAKGSELDAADAALIEKILRLADMAKFAKHSFKEDERKEILKTASDFVENDNTKRLSAKSQTPDNTDNSAK